MKKYKIKKIVVKCNQCGNPTTYGKLCSRCTVEYEDKIRRDFRNGTFEKITGIF